MPAKKIAFTSDELAQLVAAMKLQQAQPAPSRVAQAADAVADYAAATAATAKRAGRGFLEGFRRKPKPTLTDEQRALLQRAGLL